MIGIVVAIIPLLACSEIIPGVGEADTVAVTEIQVEAEVCGTSGEGLGHQRVGAKQRIENIVHIIHDVCKIGTGGNGVNRQGEMDEGGQPGMRGIGLVVGEIAFHPFLRAQFVEKGDREGGILQILKLLPFQDVVCGGTGPEMPPLDRRIQAAVKEFQFHRIGTVGTIHFEIIGFVASSEELQMAAFPFVGDTHLFHIKETAVGEGDRALVEAFRAADAGIEVNPEPVGLGVVIIRALGKRASAQGNQSQKQQRSPE